MTECCTDTDRGWLWSQGLPAWMWHESFIILTTPRDPTRNHAQLSPANSSVCVLMGYWIFKYCKVTHKAPYVYPVGTKNESSSKDKKIWHLSRESISTKQNNIWKKQIGKWNGTIPCCFWYFAVATIAAVNSETTPELEVLGHTVTFWSNTIRSAASGISNIYKPYRRSIVIENLQNL